MFFERAEFTNLADPGPELLTQGSRLGRIWLMSSTASWNEENPLEKVTCTNSDCERDLHSFLRKYPRGQSYRNGSAATAVSTSSTGTD